MKKFLLLISLVAGVIAFVVPAQAMTVDLTSLGAFGVINGAIFSSPPSIVSGTGLIDSFVRIQRTGTEQGYNVDVEKQKDFEYDEKFGEFTHSLQLSAIQDNVYTDSSGNTYYEFVVDINETAPDSLLTMHELEIYLHDTGDVLGHAAGWGTPIYDLGDNNVVELNYNLFPGSGRLDMIALIPTDLFGSDPDKYVYLYSAFGSPNASDDGVEEWAHKLEGTFTGGFDPQAVIPEPATLLLLGSGLVGFAVNIKKSFKRKRS